MQFRALIFNILNRYHFGPILGHGSVSDYQYRVMRYSAMYDIEIKIQ